MGASIEREDFGIIFIMAICVGLWSAFVFATEGAGEFYEYTQQGQVDTLASEIPKENPPVLPPVSLTQFIIGASLSVLGVAGALSCAILATISAFRKKVFHRLTYYIVGYNLLIWVWYLILLSFYLPLPSISQNVMFFLFWGLPCMLCILFDVFWLYWTSKKKQ